MSTTNKHTRRVAVRALMRLLDVTPESSSGYVWVTLLGRGNGKRNENERMSRGRNADVHAKIAQSALALVYAVRDSGYVLVPMFGFWNAGCTDIASATVTWDLHGKPYREP